MSIEEKYLQKLRGYARQVEMVGQLETCIVQPSESGRSSDEGGPDSLVVLMHGYGAPRDDLVGLAAPLLVECFKLELQPILAFPGAPHMPPELGGGSAWWPINMARLMEAAAKHSFDQMRNEVPPGIDEAREAVAETTELLMARYGMDSSRLTLGGFSQGAMLAVDTAARGLKEAPAKLIAFSGACICEKQWRASGDRLGKTLAFQSHGSADQILPLETGGFLNEVLTDLCASVEYEKFGGYHEIPEAAIEAAAKLIAR